MINRYTTNLEIKKERDGTRYYATVLNTTVPVDVFQFVVIAKAGDRYDTLAARYYKDAGKWWVIAKANNLVNGSLLIPPGAKVIIPSAGL